MQELKEDVSWWVLFLVNNSTAFKLQMLRYYFFNRFSVKGSPGANI